MRGRKVAKRRWILISRTREGGWGCRRTFLIEAGMVSWRRHHSGKRAMGGGGKWETGNYGGVAGRGRLVLLRIQELLIFVRHCQEKIAR